jgi:hypothetical protein
MDEELKANFISNYAESREWFVKELDELIASYGREARLEELEDLNKAMSRIADPPAVLMFTREVCRRRIKNLKEGK